MTQELWFCSSGGGSDIQSRPSPLGGGRCAQEPDRRREGRRTGSRSGSSSTGRRAEEGSRGPRRSWGPAGVGAVSHRPGSSDPRPRTVSTSTCDRHLVADPAGSDVTSHQAFHEDRTNPFYYHHDAFASRAPAPRSQSTDAINAVHVNPRRCYQSDIRHCHPCPRIFWNRTFTKRLRMNWSLNVDLSRPPFASLGS